MYLASYIWIKSIKGCLNSSRWFITQWNCSFSSFLDQSNHHAGSLWLAACSERSHYVAETINRITFFINYLDKTNSVVLRVNICISIQLYIFYINKVLEGCNNLNGIMMVERFKVGFFSPCVSHWYVYRVFIHTWKT